ncbi:hypothetical protein SRRS_23400 [Sporomusa rhizae]|uniref:flagellar export protein FliJ n=1 Tax=Sporomusa rhizae TaxID=357999 RepID=UPI00352AA52E
MKKFRFRLETLLKFRKMREEEAQIKLAEANIKLRKEQDILKDLRKKQADIFLLLNQKQTNSPTIETLKTYSYYIDKIKSDITAQQEEVAKAAAYRQECLVVMEDAMKQRKLVDNLRTKRLEQYNDELLHEEQKILDELGTQAYMRDRESV